jgi:two-component system response regulator FixJ
MVPCDTTIFIIDDDEPVRDSMKVLLESYDMTVRDFASCGDFLEAPDPTGVAEHHCLLLDMHMPVMDGLTFMTVHADRLRGLPVIMITGCADQRTRARAQQAGVAAFLEKPVEDTVLLAAIDHALAAAEPASAVAGLPVLGSLSASAGRVALGIAAARGKLS